MSRGQHAWLNTYTPTYSRRLRTYANNEFLARDLDAEDVALLERIRAHGCMDGSLASSLYQPQKRVSEEVRFWTRPLGVLEQGRRVGDLAGERSAQKLERLRQRKILLEVQAERYAERAEARAARAAQQALEAEDRAATKAERAAQKAAHKALIAEELAAERALREEERAVIAAELEEAERVWQAEQQRLAKEAAERIARMKQADIEWERAGARVHRGSRFYTPEWKRLEAEDKRKEKFHQQHVKRWRKIAKVSLKVAREVAQGRAEEEARQKQTEAERAAAAIAWAKDSAARQAERQQMAEALRNAESKWKDTGVKPKLRDYKAEARAVAEVERQPGACPGDTCIATPRCQIGKCNRAAFFEIKRQRQEAAAKAERIERQRQADEEEWQRLENLRNHEARQRIGRCQPGTCKAGNTCAPDECKRSLPHTPPRVYEPELAAAADQLKQQICTHVNGSWPREWTVGQLMAATRCEDREFLIRCCNEIVAEGRMRSKAP